MLLSSSFSYRGSGLISRTISTFLVLLVLIVVTLCLWSEARPSSKDLEQYENPSNKFLDQYEDDESGFRKEEDLSRFRVAILAELGLEVDEEQLVSLPKANISQAEYTRAYAEYMENVRSRKRHYRTYTYGHQERKKTADRVIETFSNIGLGPVTPGSVPFFYDEDNNLEKEERMLRFIMDLDVENKFHIRIKKALITLPDGCFIPGGKNTTTKSSSTQTQPDVDVTDFVTLWMRRYLKIGDPYFNLTTECPSFSSNTSEEGDEMNWIGPPGGFSRIENELQKAQLTIIYTKISESQLKQSHLKRRSKRSSGHTLLNFKDHTSVKSRDCDQTRHGKTCCRRSMKISFEDLKIKDLILEPKEFDAHMCSGRCNAKRVPYATTHAMFQHTLHQSKGKEFAPRPCCTPVKLRHLDVLHTVPGTDKLQITILQNAIVEECRCS